MMAARNSFVYLCMSMFFLLGWLLTLIGLSLVQDWCNDNEDQAAPFISAFNGVLEDNCKKFYGLQWFVWALNTIPIGLAVFAIFSPKYARGPMTAFFSALAPLNVLMTHDFYRKVDIAENFFSDSLEKKNRTALAGFAIMAAMALLLLLFDWLLVPSPDNIQRDAIVAAAPEEHVKGGAAPSQPAAAPAQVV